MEKSSNLKNQKNTLEKEVKQLEEKVSLYTTNYSHHNTINEIKDAKKELHSLKKIKRKNKRIKNLSFSKAGLSILIPFIISGAISYGIVSWTEGNHPYQKYKIDYAYMVEEGSTENEINKKSIYDYNKDNDYLILKTSWKEIDEKYIKEYYKVNKDLFPNLPAQTILQLDEDTIVKKIKKKDIEEYQLETKEELTEQERENNHPYIEIKKGTKDKENYKKTKRNTKEVAGDSYLHILLTLSSYAGLHLISGFSLFNIVGKNTGKYKKYKNEVKTNTKDIKKKKEKIKTLKKNKR